MAGAEGGRATRLHGLQGFKLRRASVGLVDRIVGIGCEGLTPETLDKAELAG